MTSLYAGAWKTFTHFLIKLFWTFISYLRSFSFRSSPLTLTTPKPRVNRRSEVDLECGKPPCNPGLNASPATPHTPTPCFRRQRASTLCAYTPPNAKSTSGRSTVVSRSSGPVLSSIARNVAHASASGDVILAAHNRLSDKSLITAPCVLFQGTIDEARQSVVGPGCDEEILTAETGDAAELIVNRGGPKYVSSSQIHGMKLKVPNRLPFKCLSAMKTLSLGVASSNGLYLKKDHKRVSSLAALSELKLSGSRSGISFSKQAGSYLGRSCSLDQGLSLLQGPLTSVQSKSNDNVFARRPRSSIQSYELRANGSPFSDHITAALVLGHHDGILHSRNALQNNRSKTMWRSGRGTTGLYDVSFVKRVFSVMRADDVGQDGQDVRNIFNRESIWDHRKSAIPSVKPLSQRYSKRVAGKHDENDIFMTPPRKNRVSRRGAALSAGFRETKKNQDMAKPAPNKRTRHRSAMYESSPSPSIERQLKVERIKRQRKLRQEIMSRVVSNQLCTSNQEAHDSYDWFAQDEAIPVTC